MSRVILCAGKTAQKPYVLKTSGVNVYTIEELCYCLRGSLDMLDENTIDREMALFIKNELGFEERGSLLEEMVLTKADLKSRLVVIFCTGDYFDRDEITRICNEIDELAAMSRIGRMKRRADRFMEDGNIRIAASEYRRLLADQESSSLSQVEYGNVLHNIGIADIRSRSYQQAAENFREAYERNENTESLKCYLYALKLGHNDKLYVSEAMRLLDSSELVRKVEEELEDADERAVSSGEYEQIDRLKILFQQGRSREFERLADDIIATLKARYRANNDAE
ncbi:MAG: hypothetical protein K6E85_08780 [Lachnospiraceae bacterium]|nr:hypothetical protein [Lachnospiraceae bacterium]